MQITTPVPPSPVHLSHAKEMPRPGQNGAPPVVELGNDVKALLSDLMEPDLARRAKGLEQQNKIKAHTIYTVGGKVVAMQWANGWSTLEKEANAASSDMPKIEGADRRAAYIEKTLRQMYGDKLKVHDFSNDPSAPTMGDLEPVIQHRRTLEDVLSARSGSTGSPSPLLSLTGTSMSILHGRSR